MSYFDGQLVPSFGVKCGKCKTWNVPVIASAERGTARTPSEARSALTIAGWEMTRAWGLICPKCSGYRPGTERAA